MQWTECACSKCCKWLECLLISRDRPKIDFTFSTENETGAENGSSFSARNRNENEKNCSFSAENENGNKQIKQQHIIMKFSI